MPTATYTIETRSNGDLSDDEIRELNRLWNELRAESRPEDPPIPDGLTIAEIRSAPDFFEFRRFLARATDGTLVAYATCNWDTKAAENKHLLDSTMGVLREHRRRGLGTMLLSRVLDVADEQNRQVLIGWTNDRVPSGSAFATQVGALAKQQVRISRLLLADLDRALIERWVAEGPVRAADYELVYHEGPYPLEWYGDVIHVHEIMNTAPRDDLEMEDWKITEDDLRAWDTELVNTGARRWSLFVRHRDTGRFVGYTEIGWNPSIPGLRFQFNTAVEPAHRGHALGKWLKAEMLRRVLDANDDATEIRTGNAESNDAMLGINVALGFTPHFGSHVWQLDATAARQALG